MIRFQTQLELAKFLKTLAVAEVEVETARNLLAEKEEFDPILAFKRIDWKNRGHITPDDFSRFLKDLDVPARQSDIYNLFRFYDCDGDLRLTYTDFLRLVLPQSRADLHERALMKRHPQFYVNKRISTLVEWGIARIIEREIIVNKSLEVSRRQLIARPDWDCNDAFALLDYEKTGAIDAFALLMFFNQNQIVANSETVTHLLHRVDRDQDELLTFPEFVQIFAPSEQVIQTTKKVTSISSNYCLGELRSKEHVGLKLEPEGTHEKNSMSPKANRISKTSTITYPAEFEDSRSTRVPFKLPIDYQGQNNAQDSDLLERRTQSVQVSFHRRQPSLPTVLDSCYNNKIDTMKEHSSPQRKERNLIETTESYSPIRPTQRSSVVSNNQSTSDIEARLSPRKTNSPVKNYGNLAIDAYSTNRSDLSTDYVLSPTRLSQFNGSPTPSISSPKNDNRFSYHKRAISVIDYSGNEGLSPLSKRSTKESTSSVQATPQKKVSHMDLYVRSTKSEAKMNEKDQHYFITALAELMELMKEIEETRISVALQPDFTGVGAFKMMIDLLGDNNTQRKRFEDVLKAHGIILKQKESTALFQVLDRDSDGIISLKDFQEAIYPSHKEYVNAIGRRKPVILKRGTQALVLNFLLKVVDVEIQWGEIKKKLWTRPNFSLLEAYQLLDEGEKGYIKLSDIKRVFESQKIKTAEQNLWCLMVRLDVDRDERISYEEFMREFN